MLTHRFPYPPNRGDRIRSYNLLRVLAAEYSVTLGCTTDEPIADADRKHVAAICEELFIAPLGRIKRLARGARAMIAGKSLTEGMFLAPSLAKRVRSWQRDKPFDAVVVFCSSMYPYVDEEAFASTPKFVDLVDVDSEKWRQMGAESAFPKSWLYGREAACVRSLEQRIAEQADAVTLVSDAEARLFKRTVHAACPVEGVSNGVDTEYFRRPAMENSSAGMSAGNHAARPRQTHHNSKASPGTGSSPTRLVFTGVLDYSPNVEGMIWFCKQILPKLRQALNVELLIVGRRPNQRVQELGKIPGVRLVGEVPDVRPYLGAADIAISPLKLARGIQNKVLEAMAFGLPVVLTTQSSEGIDAFSGQHFLIADTIDEWCRAIVDLSQDSMYRATMGASARALVEAEYSWPARLNGFLRLLSSEKHPAGIVEPSLNSRGNERTGVDSSC